MKRLRNWIRLLLAVVSLVWSARALTSAAVSLQTQDASIAEAAITES